MKLADNPNIEQTLQHFNLLQEVTSVDRLTGGLTNTNYRVQVPGRSYFLRISNPQSSVLGINREDERINTMRAHRAGVGPELLAASPLHHALLIEWIEGRTLSADALHEEAFILPAIANSLRKLHQGPAFNNRFDFSLLRRRYKDVVLSNNYFLPEHYKEMEFFIESLEQALSIQPEGLVPCHNDLLAANFMINSEQAWIIDYEYSGQNEPSFDIGNLASECSLSEESLTILCNAYWQEYLPGKIARAKAWSIIARYGWVLWASIQEATSQIDFDFRTFGKNKWNSVIQDLKPSNITALVSIIKEQTK